MKLNLIYYKCLLDLAIEEFVKCYEDFFTKDQDRYVFGLNVSKKKLYGALEECIEECLSRVMACSGKNGIFLVIGSCYPKDNLLLEFKDDNYFPRKLSNLIDSKPSLKWLLKEKDIEIDIDLFNEAFISIFNKHFNRQELKRSSALAPKTVFVSHTHLDCYMLFKTIKWAYGSSNCCNVWKEKLAERRQNLVALNELVSKYIHNKSRMNKSVKFKKYAHEVKDYLDEKIGIEA